MKHGIVEGEATHLRYTPGWLVRALLQRWSKGRADNRRDGVGPGPPDDNEPPKD